MKVALCSSPEVKNEGEDRRPKRVTAFVISALFFGFGVLSCLMASIPLIICSVYQETIVVGLSDELKIFGAGLLVFGLIVMTFSGMAMIYLGDFRRRKMANTLTFIMEDSLELDYPHDLAFTNPIFEKSPGTFYNNLNLTTVPL